MKAWELLHEKFLMDVGGSGLVQELDRGHQGGNCRGLAGIASSLGDISPQHSPHSSWSDTPAALQARMMGMASACSGADEEGAVRGGHMFGHLAGVSEGAAFGGEDPLVDGAALSLNHHQSAMPGKMLTVDSTGSELQIGLEIAEPHEFPVMGNHSRGRAGSTGSVDEVSMRSWAHEPLQSRGSDSFLMNGSDDNETEEHEEQFHRLRKAFTQARNRTRPGLPDDTTSAFLGDELSVYRHNFFADIFHRRDRTCRGIALTHDHGVLGGGSRCASDWSKQRHNCALGGHEEPGLCLPSNVAMVTPGLRVGISRRSAAGASAPVGRTPQRIAGESSRDIIKIRQGTVPCLLTSTKVAAISSLGEQEVDIEDDDESEEDGNVVSQRSGTAFTTSDVMDDGGTSAKSSRDTAPAMARVPVPPLATLGTIAAATVPTRHLSSRGEGQPRLVLDRRAVTGMSYRKSHSTPTLVETGDDHDHGDPVMLPLLDWDDWTADHQHWTYPAVVRRYPRCLFEQDATVQGYPRQSATTPLWSAPSAMVQDSGLEYESAEAGASNGTRRQPTDGLGSGASAGVSSVKQTESGVEAFKKFMDAQQGFENEWKGAAEMPSFSSAIPADAVLDSAPRYSAQYPEPNPFEPHCLGEVWLRTASASDPALPGVGAGPWRKRWLVLRQTYLFEFLERPPLLSSSPSSLPATAPRSASLRDKQNAVNGGRLEVGAIPIKLDGLEWEEENKAFPMPVGFLCLSQAIVEDRSMMWGPRALFLRCSACPALQLGGSVSLPEEAVRTEIRVELRVPSDEVAAYWTKLFRNRAALEVSSIFDPGPDARHSGASSLCSSDEDECYDEEDYEDYAEALRGTTHGFPKLGMGRFSSVVCARRKDSWRSQGHDNELRALKIINKRLFWDRVRAAKERCDTLAREVFCQALLTIEETYANIAIATSITKVAEPCAERVKVYSGDCCDGDDDGSVLDRGGRDVPLESKCGRKRRFSGSDGYKGDHVACCSSSKLAGHAMANKERRECMYSGTCDSRARDGGEEDGEAPSWERCSVPEAQARWAISSLLSTPIEREPSYMMPGREAALDVRSGLGAIDTTNSGLDVHDEGKEKRHHDVINDEVCPGSTQRHLKKDAGVGPGEEGFVGGNRDADGRDMGGKDGHRAGGGRQHIVRLYSVLETVDELVLEMDYMSTENLFRTVDKKGVLTEPEAAGMMRNLLSAIYDCNKHGFCHRDIKPANLLFLNTIPSSAPKGVILSDFGMAARAGPDGLVSGRCGTPGYVAPEIFQAGVEQGYGMNVDMFSAGVVLYVCLYGVEPFYAATDHELMVANKKAVFDFPARRNVSNEAKDLISKMMEREPSMRITPRDALYHPWILHHCGRLGA